MILHLVAFVLGLLAIHLLWRGLTVPDRSRDGRLRGQVEIGLAKGFWYGLGLVAATPAYLVTFPAIYALAVHH